MNTVRKNHRGIIIIGPICSGKDTRSVEICERYDLAHVSVSTVLKEISKDLNSENGKIIKDYMDRAKLVPDDIVLKAVKEFLEKNEGKNFLLNGCPRTTNQLSELQEFFTIDSIIYLNVSDDTVLKRSAGRLVCDRCKKTTRVALLEKGDRCPHCKQGVPKPRKDDDSETVKSRLAEFYEETMPVIETLMNGIGKGDGSGSIFLEVDAEKGDNAIWCDIADHLNATIGHLY